MIAVPSAGSGPTHPGPTRPTTPPPPPRPAPPTPDARRADLVIRSARAHIETILAAVDSSYSLDRGTDSGATHRETLGFHAEAALRDLARLSFESPAGTNRTQEPPPAVRAACGPGRPGGPPAPGGGAYPALAGAEEPTPGSAVALGTAMRESPAATVTARGAGADLHDPGEMPGTSAIAELINRNVRRGRHHA
jgi:hypothetical protein